MKVYRVEHSETKIGPYNAFTLYPPGSLERLLLSEMGVEHSGDPKHPGCDSDEMRISYAHKFGCDSIEKLYSWFEGFMDYLLPMGFEIIEYEVPNLYVVYGKSRLQLAFRFDQVESAHVVGKYTEN